MKGGNRNRGYTFAYDGIGRLNAAYYGEGASLAANSGRYDELVAYDKTGNIKTLQRQPEERFQQKNSGYPI